MARILTLVNTTETWQSHFTSRGWASPQEQREAGYARFLQPTVPSSTYVETFDFGTILPRSRVTLSYGEQLLDGYGYVKITPKIELSDDNATWTVSNGVMSVFGTSFRYVRITLTIDQEFDTTTFFIESLSIRLDAKLKSDAGKTACLSTDVSGTVSNFATEYLDVSSITVTAAGVTPVTAVYDFQGSVIKGTYSLAANVCTVSATAHSLVVGQKVRLDFTSGAAPAGRYAVASVINANSYTVALTAANTSGNVSTYPQGLRIFLFNSAGARVSGSASWAIKGY